MSQEETGLLILSHSSRNTNMRFCSRAYLERRYADPDRLTELPPFNALSPIPTYFDGSLSFYRVAHGETMSIKPLGSIRAKAKIQHALPLDDSTLLVGFETHLEVWSFPLPIAETHFEKPPVFEIKKTIRHPHFPGIRTVNRYDAERVLLSSAAADTVLMVNWVSGAIEKRFVMPENLYGSGYRVDSDMDLQRHYIANRYQRTHLNSAHGFENQIVVSTLIQGAIGVFDLEKDQYRELARGYVGCHGARFNASGEIYFVDSCSGRLIFLDRDGRESGSYETGSRWLHDAVHLIGDYYAFALADTNELQIHEIGKKHRVFRKRFPTSPAFFLNPIFRLIPGWVGNSTQFLAFRKPG